jgi:Bifunctional DNA primase/polymerase, N-terminal
MTKEIALQYHSFGLSVIPTKSDKRPIGAWKASQTARIEPDDRFNNAPNIAIIGGKVSGNLECIDVDLKYDLTGTLMARYKAAISACDESLLKKLVVEKTPSAGYHFIYRVEESCNIDGNKKLAQRPATEEEKLKEPNVKCFVLLETRGEGGYFLCAPSPDYSLIQHDFSTLPILTSIERSVLLDCALSLNEYFEEPLPLPTKNIPVGEDGITPLDDYNKRGDVLAFLISKDWKLVDENSKNWNLLRPGQTTSATSAGLRKSDNVFHCFSTSTPFDTTKGYSPAGVYAVLQHNGDFSAAARDLFSQGYGKREVKATQKVTQTQKQTITADDNDFSFLAPKEDIDTYIQQNVDGTFEMGKFCGIPSLDKYFKFKRAHLNIFLGLDNVGKSNVVWYLMLLSARIHGWRWIVYAAENSAGYFVRRMCEFYSGIEIQHMTKVELKEARTFIDQHFTIIDNSDGYTYKDLLNAGEKLCNQAVREGRPYSGFLWDPYNGVQPDRAELKEFGSHEYHYFVASQLKQFIKKHDCCIYIPSHAVTEALRRIHPKGAKLRISDTESIDIEGYPMPPHKADIEGGGKWASRADDFVIIHRYYQHPDIWHVVEFHVEKVKLQETGGKPTSKDSPVRLAMGMNKCTFKDGDTNPMTGRLFKTELKPEPISEAQSLRNIYKRPIPPITHYNEPREKEEVEPDEMQAKLDRLADEIESIPK